MNLEIKATEKIYGTSQEILNMNEVIANFDGRKKRMINGEEWWSDVGDYDCFQWHPEDLNYHASWDWIMPVAKKCKERLDALPVESIKSEAGYMYTIYEMLQTLNPALVHRAVFNFIERYNKLTK